MAKTKILGKPGFPSFHGDVNQCPTCFEVFNSTAGFDMHRTGKFSPNTRKCMTEAEMLAAGMALNAKNRWITKVNLKWSSNV